MPQHSPVIFWLLVAATLAVNGVAIRWMSLAGELSLAAYFYEALISGELGVVCLWSVFSARRALWGWVAVVGAVLAAAFATAYATELSFVEAGSVYGAYVSILVVALWVLKRTTLWHRISGANPVEWQYSLAHLLAVMTLVAILIAALRYSSLVSDFHELWKFLAAMTLGDVTLVVGTTIMWAWSRERQCPPHLWPRLGAVWGFAGVLGIAESVLARSGLVGKVVATEVWRRAGAEFVAYMMIMALVIFLWLELVPIVPVVPRAELPREN